MGSVKLTDGNFPAGSQVGLYERVGDFRGNLIDRQEVGNGGEIEFTGLEVGAPLYLAALDGEGPNVATVAQDPDVQSDQPQDPNPAEVPSQPGITGARSSATRRTSQQPVRQNREAEAEFPSSEAVSKADAHSFGGNDTESTVIDDDGVETVKTEPSPTDPQAGKRARKQGADANPAAVPKSRERKAK